jgi:hypothetical protein
MNTQKGVFCEDFRTGTPCDVSAYFCWQHSRTDSLDKPFVVGSGNFSVSDCSSLFLHLGKHSASPDYRAVAVLGFDYNGETGK